MKTEDLSKFDWLVGQWEGIQGDGIYHEEWEKLNDTEFKGRAYTIKKGEIANVEKLKLHSGDKGTYYTADVSHNPAPVSFLMTFFDDKAFVFENPKHDFPQKITYEKKGNGSLIATIEAMVKGKRKKFEFRLSLVL